MASGNVTGEEHGEVTGGDRKVTAHPLWNRQHLDTKRGKVAGQKPVSPQKVFRSMNIGPT